MKAVVQAIPTFAMSYFKLPIGLCNDIEKLIRKFSGYEEEIDEKSIWKIGRLYVNQRLKVV